jgi:acylphosphatase
MTHITRRLVISGRVQGVWFRESMRQEATRHGVHGWVRNCRDGTVEAVLHGPEDAVRVLIDWAHAGPPQAEVIAVAVMDEEGSFAGFDVRATA